MTTAQATTPYYYVSIAYYNHLVFKCGGMCPDQKHRDYYEPHYRKIGIEWTSDRQKLEDQGPYEVVVLDSYIADRITMRDGRWVEFTGR